MWMRMQSRIFMTCLVAACWWQMDHVLKDLNRCVGLSDLWSRMYKQDFVKFSRISRIWERSCDGDMSSCRGLNERVCLCRRQSQTNTSYWTSLDVFRTCEKLTYLRLMLNFDKGERTRISRQLQNLPSRSIETRRGPHSYRTHCWVCGGFTQSHTSLETSPVFCGTIVSFQFKDNWEKTVKEKSCFGVCCEMDLRISLFTSSIFRNTIFRKWGSVDWDANDRIWVTRSMGHTSRYFRRSVSQCVNVDTDELMQIKRQLEHNGSTHATEWAQKVDMPLEEGQFREKLERAETRMTILTVFFWMSRRERTCPDTESWDARRILLQFTTHE